MVRYRRNAVPAGVFFFTVAVVDRRSTRLVTHIDLLRAAFRKAQAERPFTIDAIVVLPEHLHAILTLPDDDADFAHRWRRIKSIFTEGVRGVGVELPGRDKRGYTLWQRRFWEHTIRDDADYERHVDYIHYNPVKHGYVGRAADWPHSSFHRFVRDGVLPADWGGGVDFSGGFGER
jgi:putative transposase